MLAAAFLFFATAAPAVAQDRTPLRTGCEASDSVIATLDAGQAVTIRFAMAGGSQTCYKVDALSAGQTVTGYLPAAALTTTEAFDRERKAGASLDLARLTRQQTSAQPVSATNEGRYAQAVALMDQQPAEALRVLQTMLPQRGGPPELLTLAGIAAYRADQPGEAEKYLEQAQEARPDAQVAALLEQIQREKSNDKSGEKLFGTRFLLRYDGTSLEPAIAHRLLTVLEEEYSRVSGYLGCQPNERIVTVVQTLEAFRKTTGAAEWSSGQYDGKIHFALMEREIGPQTRRALAHEIVHACLANLGGFPTWLHEGFAQRLSGDTMGEAERRSIRELVRSGQLRPLSQLGKSWMGLTPEEAQKSYRYALDAADVFFLKYQPIGIANVLRGEDLLRQAILSTERELLKP